MGKPSPDLPDDHNTKVILDAISKPQSDTHKEVSKWFQRGTDAGLNKLGAEDPDVPSDIESSKLYQDSWSLGYLRADRLRRTRQLKRWSPLLAISSFAMYVLLPSQYLPLEKVVVILAINVLLILVVLLR